ncbi:MAG: hypothetical protein AABW85_04155 [archaeon]
MLQKFDPHNLERRFERELAKINELYEPNKSLILGFVENYRYKKK